MLSSAVFAPARHRKLMSGSPEKAFDTSTKHPTTMSEETEKPESISDEQLEDVAGGMMDNFVGTKNCTAALSTLSL